MFDDFFIRALFVGIGMALVTGPLGCLLFGEDYRFLEIH